MASRCNAAQREVDFLVEWAMDHPVGRKERADITGERRLDLVQIRHPTPFARSTLDEVALTDCHTGDAIPPGMQMYGMGSLMKRALDGGRRSRAGRPVKHLAGIWQQRIRWDQIAGFGLGASSRATCLENKICHDHRDLRSEPGKLSTRFPFLFLC
ncbi:MAG: hypothetical protein BGO05_27830 [Rhizobiales bacterium 63-7]|nr:MAG: hypothetical protein BGO05_27830 [Rhizobiales bacterium 63-7]